MTTNLATSPHATTPVFRAIASSTKQMHQMLKCISFAKKVHVELTRDTIKFAADSSRVVQAIASLDKSVFKSFSLNIPEVRDDSETVYPTFQISLAAFLETLLIFGVPEAAARQTRADHDPNRSNLLNYRPDAFSHRILDVAGTCVLSYPEEGGSFTIIIEETGVKTTCNLVTYLPEAAEGIPFDREAIAFKIITQSCFLLNALSEIAHTNPTDVVITVSKKSPYLKISSNGPLGEASVGFAKGRDLMETFSVQDKWVQRFKFDMIKHSLEAMRLASKVSMRGDAQGVLSMQFMVDVEGSRRNFLMFAFVPYVEKENETDEEEEGEEAEEAGEATQVLNRESWS